MTHHHVFEEKRSLRDTLRALKEALLPNSLAKGQKITKDYERLCTGPKSTRIQSGLCQTKCTAW